MPSLELCAVAFVDLLGFRARIRETQGDSAAAQALLDEYDRVIADGLSALGESTERFTYKGFTDNLVIAVPLSSGHPEVTIGSICTGAARFQFSLAMNGWFVRGGVAVGNFYMDERLVFGEALLEAYTLESEVARDPRIVLSDEVLELNRQFLKYYSFPEESPQNLLVLLDQDGRAFLNYLAVPLYHGANRRVRREALANHKTQVEGALAATKGDSRVWDKYRWVADYHDFYLEAWTGLHDSGEPIATDSRARRPSLLVPFPTAERETDLMDVESPEVAEDSQADEESSSPSEHWICQECKKRIADGDGMIQIFNTDPDLGPVGGHPRKKSDELDDVYEAVTAEKGNPESPIVDFGLLAEAGEKTKVRIGFSVVHTACDTNDEEDSYWLDVERAATMEEWSEWVIHLSRKRWMSRGDLMRMLGFWWSHHTVPGNEPEEGEEPSIG